MRNLAERCRSGALPAEVVAVVSSRPGVKGLERAAELGLPTWVVPRREYDGARPGPGALPGEGGEERFSRDVFRLVEDSGAGLVCLAGFMSLLRIPEAWAGRVLNVHPSLLPAFGGEGMYGQRVHQAVLDHGCKVTGCTVHLADEAYDTGPILVQRCCEVHETDTPETLAARVAEQEREAYPEAVRLLLQGRVRVTGRRVTVLPQPTDPPTMESEP